MNKHAQRFLLPAALAFALLTGSASAAEDEIIKDTRQFYSGNALLEVCLSQHPLDRACWGYTTGIADAMGGGEAFGETLFGWSACIPTEVTVYQLADVTIRYLQEHPEKRHWGAGGLVARAFREAFPCPQAAKN
jgi:hypothetical protein